MRFLKILIFIFISLMLIACSALTSDKVYSSSKTAQALIIEDNKIYLFVDGDSYVFEENAENILLLKKSQGYIDKIKIENLSYSNNNDVVLQLTVSYNTDSKDVEKDNISFSFLGKSKKVENKDETYKQNLLKTSQKFDVKYHSEEVNSLGELVAIAAIPIIVPVWMLLTIFRK